VFDKEAEVSQPPQQTLDEIKLPKDSQNDDDMSEDSTSSYNEEIGYKDE
jgi:hypothetical protein